MFIKVESWRRDFAMAGRPRASTSQLSPTGMRAPIHPSVESKLCRPPIIGFGEDDFLRGSPCTVRRAGADPAGGIGGCGWMSRGGGTGKMVRPSNSILCASQPRCGRRAGGEKLQNCVGAGARTARLCRQVRLSCRFGTDPAGGRIFLDSFHACQRGGCRDTPLTLLLFLLSTAYCTAVELLAMHAASFVDGRR
ncbi:uncharacterized protein F5Z01DRAFT_548872 [Emericellopsis atlantica]|uniref:Uncharacterized protein n=1 Tax=Emericellopsis atlantica TaxID=2614577 RepID=A0A9P7ZNW6_9HYPO|nr:uncharacterized protein F5Z01DRAFT_548872 [Emericellopsis atlantica]KAG9255579.1 hypothetical protein F5Z01DRAFT_548872 [Emericellopsis atlantica]